MSERTRLALEALRGNPERFWSKVKKGPGDGCWEWTGTVGSHGYGVVNLPGSVQETAHRVAYATRIGGIPARMSVLHHCDNRRCVRPGHLFLGSQADNMRDMASKGRAARGEAKKTTKLTREDVWGIRRMRADGVTYREISSRLSLPAGAVVHAALGDTWAWLKEAA